MSDEHYSGHDPETGCGLMILCLAVVALVVWTIFFAAVFDWWVFA
jgi:hypothetical protein